jgi:hypothetical protein
MSTDVVGTLLQFAPLLLNQVAKGSQSYPDQNPLGQLLWGFNPAQSYPVQSPLGPNAYQPYPGQYPLSALNQILTPANPQAYPNQNPLGALSQMLTSINSYSQPHTQPYFQAYPNQNPLGALSQMLTPINPYPYPQPYSNQNPLGIITQMPILPNTQLGSSHFVDIRKIAELNSQNKEISPDFLAAISDYLDYVTQSITYMSSSQINDLAKHFGSTISPNNRNQAIDNLKTVIIADITQRAAVATASAKLTSVDAKKVLQS